MGARTDAARSEVLAARAGLDEELVRLEAAGRAAVDVPARIRRQPAKVLGAAGGAAFVLLGGPKRVFNRARRAVFGPTAGIPKSMLPPEVEKTLGKLGADGDKVRGTLEREFAAYLDEKAPLRRRRDITGTAAALMSEALTPVAKRLGRQLAEQAFDPDGPSFAEGMRRARARTAGTGAAASPQNATTASPGTPPPSDSDRPRS